MFFQLGLLGYQCYTKNKKRSKAVSFLEVLEEVPHVELDPKHVIVDVGEQVLLNCKVTPNSLITRVYWTKNDVKLRENSRVRILVWISFPVLFIADQRVMSRGLQKWNRGSEKKCMLQMEIAGQRISSHRQIVAVWSSSIQVRGIEQTRALIRWCWSYCSRFQWFWLWGV